jgi:RND family efflux transporter MFP subunit
MRTTICLTLLTLASLVGCSRKDQEQEPVVSVQTAIAQKTSIQQLVTTEAVLFPRNQAAITPKVSAPVRRFFVNRGSRVHKGQLLAELENRDIAAVVTENKGALEQAQATYETITRASLPEDLTKAEQDAKSAHEVLDAQQKLYESRQMLFKEGALPRKDLDQAAVALVQARAQSQVADQHLAAIHAVGKQQTTKSAAGQLTSAQGKFEGSAAQLSYTAIRSPIEGVVTDRPVWPGETPAAGTPIITVMDTSSVTARAHIPQSDAAMLKVGDPALITTSEGSEIAARVTIVSPALDPGSTTVEVWVEAANKSGTLRPGSTVQVKITASKIDDVITVPVAAVLRTSGEATTVMVVGSDGRAHQTEVETGVRNGDVVQIVKGLNPRQTVVTTGAYGLPDRTLVKTVTSKDSAQESKPTAEKD